MNLSKKRAAEMRVYNKARKEFLSEILYCQASIGHVCTCWPTQIHHMAGKIGANLNDQSKWLAVCQNCHDWIEGHPKEAKERGLSFNRLT
jgi:hypothetical protein